MLALLFIEVSRVQGNSLYHWKFNEIMSRTLAELFNSLVAQPLVSLSPAHGGWDFPVFIHQWSPHFFCIALSEKKSIRIFQSSTAYHGTFILVTYLKLLLHGPADGVKCKTRRTWGKIRSSVNHCIIFFHFVRTTARHRLVTCSQRILFVLDKPLFLFQESLP